MSFGKMEVRPGMKVAQRGGIRIGEVRESRDDSFVFNQASSGSDVTLPYDKVRVIMGGDVWLDVLDDELSQDSRSA